MSRSLYLFLMMLSITLIFTQCSEDEIAEFTENVWVIEPGPDAQNKAQEAMIQAKQGDTIHFRAGTYDFTSTLSVDDKTNLTIRGEGMDNTILSFANQTAGAEGVKITGSNWVLMYDFTVQDPVGDGIKVKDGDGITFLRVMAEWTGDPSEDNGAYGLYPVSSSNVLIDASVAKGASDAGIYVGQCTNAIVRNSTAEGNVAGIEIENTLNADVYNNLATKNTGGILIFDLPGLPMANGSRCRVFDNTLIENDQFNFAPEGNTVGEVPTGTGIMILASKETEVFNNTITNNNVMGIGVASYLTVDASIPTDGEYSPFPSHIHIHDNILSRTNNVPPPSNFFGVLITNSIFTDGNVPDILLDGIFDPDGGEFDKICIQNNGAVDFANLDLENFLTTEWNLSLDSSPHDCSQDPLPEVSVSAPNLN